MLSEEDKERIFKLNPAIADRIVSRESGWLEFKESFNWNSMDSYARSISAFANKQGGYLIFGVKDKPRELVGLRNRTFEELDEARITEYLNGIFSPEIDFRKFTELINGKTVGIIHVSASRQQPVISIKSAGCIKEAEIYFRYNARTEKIKYPELVELLEGIRQSERQLWERHLEAILKRPDEVVVVTDPRTSTMSVGSKSGSVGVYVTNSPTAPVIRLDENNIRAEYSLDYKGLTKELYNRYQDFSANNDYHKNRTKIKAQKPELVFTRLLDPLNPKSSKQQFYHPLILEEFDRYYTRKK